MTLPTGSRNVGRSYSRALLHRTAPSARGSGPHHAGSPTTATAPFRSGSTPSTKGGAVAAAAVRAAGARASRGSRRTRCQPPPTVVPRIG